MLNHSKSTTKLRIDLFFSSAITMQSVLVFKNRAPVYQGL